MTQVESFLKNMKVIVPAASKSTYVRTQSEQQNLDELVKTVKETLSSMQEYIDSQNIHSFYNSLADLKFFIEYADEINKNWYLVRAYSGALYRLLQSVSVENAADVFQYYESKYGGRRIIRNENWFEQQRWDFLDELQLVDSVPALHKFIDKRIKRLNSSFQVFKSELLIFIKTL